MSSQIQEVDNMGVFFRSLKLLHSNEDNSVDQLRVVLEESIKSKYGSRKPVINLVGFGINKKSSNSDDLVNEKRVKLNDSMSPTLYSGRADESHTSGSDSEDGVALEILDDDLSCVVCQEMAVGAGNNLVECLECHSLYHQECHKPPITQDVNDPRFVWYCENCTKTMTKVGVSNSSKHYNSSSSTSIHQPTKPMKSSNKISSNTISSKSFSALPGKSTSSKNNNGGHFNTKSANPIPMPKINVTADKRLQIMKRNAAKKHEKRKSSK